MTFILLHILYMHFFVDSLLVWSAEPDLEAVICLSIRNLYSSEVIGELNTKVS
jgi:hypothetical protein